MSKRKFNQLMNKISSKSNLEKERIQMDYNGDFISISFDYVLSTELGDCLFIVEKLTKEMVDVITKDYIFANKIFEEKELEHKMIIIMGTTKEKELSKELIHNLEFSNNYLFHNKGIKFKVTSISEFRDKLSRIKNQTELVKQLIE